MANNPDLRPERAVNVELGARRLFKLGGHTLTVEGALFQIDRAPYEIAAAEARARAEQTAREVARLKGLAEAKAVADIFRYFGGLASELKGETIPLGEHVDYWDRLGWRDAFSSASLSTQIGRAHV